MRLYRFLSVTAVLVFVCVFGSAAHAQVPQLINYQGRVAVSGTNFSGTGQFKFALVSGSTPNVTFWSNDGTSTAGSVPTNGVSLSVTKGLYSVLLGDVALTNMSAVPASVFTNSDVRLRVWFNDGPHGWQLLTPDQRIAAVGYAMMAGSVSDGAITAAKIASGAVGSAQIADGAVGTQQLSVGAVTGTNIAPGTITATQLDPGTLAAASAPLLSGSYNDPSQITDISAIGTASQTQLPHCAEKTAWRVLVVGDSLISAGPALYATSYLQGQFGSNGVPGIGAGMDQSPQAAVDPFNGAAVWMNDTTKWLTGYYTTATTGQGVLLWNNYNSVGYSPCNEMHCYFIGSPGAGTFKIQSSLDNVAWVDEPVNGSISTSWDGAAWTSCPGTISADHAFSGGCVKVAYATRQPRIFRMVVNSGTVQFPQASPMFFSQQTGMQVTSIARPGYTLQQMLQCDPAVSLPILRDMAPDLVIFEMVHDGYSQPSRMTSLRNLIIQAGCNPDWSVCGVHAGLGGYDNGILITTFDARELQRKWAQQNNAHFFDSYFPSGGSIKTMAGRGWLSRTDRPIASASFSGTQITYTVPSHGLSSQQGVVITGCYPDDYNLCGEIYPVTVVDANTFQVAVSGTPAAFVSAGILHSDGIHPSGKFPAMAGKLWGASLAALLPVTQKTVGFHCYLPVATQVISTGTGSTGYYPISEPLFTVDYNSGSWNGTGFVVPEDGLYEIAVVMSYSVPAWFRLRVLWDGNGGPITGGCSLSLNGPSSAQYVSGAQKVILTKGSIINPKIVCDPTNAGSPFTGSLSGYGSGYETSFSIFKQ